MSRMHEHVCSEVGLWHLRFLRGAESDVTRQGQNHSYFT